LKPVNSCWQKSWTTSFFTGGTEIAKLSWGSSKNLTPVTLELGGSPCVVDSNINIEYTAKRITWGKFINAGQTCIADYLLVNSKIKQALLDSIQKYIREFYGTEPSASPDYARIINQNIFSVWLIFSKTVKLLGTK